MTTQQIAARKSYVGIGTLAKVYPIMPNGGASLCVSDDGTVNNGLFIVDRFDSRKEAELALRNHGFTRGIGGTWKLSRVSGHYETLQDIRLDSASRAILRAADRVNHKESEASHDR